jgi:putative ABC transport system substrate-binding protein
VDRRAFIAAVTGGLLAAPLGAEAQHPQNSYRIGLLSHYPYNPARAFSKVFLPALRDLGYVEGRNLRIEVRSANQHSERLPALAAELVHLDVDVIITAGDGEVRAAKAATGRIPIVMAPSGDPVRAGYIDSYARPGGNVTGLSWVSPELSAKLVEILKEALPSASRLAVLWHAANPVKRFDFEDTKRSATTLGLTVSSIELMAASDLESAFAAIRRVRPDAMVILTDEVLSGVVYARIVDFVMQQRLPSILGASDFAAAGGLINYGPSGVDMWRRAAIYVDKILKGAKPADLPVEQPTKFELVINLKTARALGLTIPQSLLVRADQVIE